MTTQYEYYQEHNPQFPGAIIIRARAISEPQVNANLVVEKTQHRHGSKQSQAIEICKRIGVANRKACIEAIISELGMSEAGASTYHYNAKKALS